jgi:transcription-repair coupling factor (superfamily II helicase)
MSTFILITVISLIPPYLQNKSEKEVNLEMIKNGDLDIIVGTHALLGVRVVYNNLGLLVVDEEQVYQIV